MRKPTYFAYVYDRDESEPLEIAVYEKDLIYFIEEATDVICSMWDIEEDEVWEKKYDLKSDGRLLDFRYRGKVVGFIEAEYSYTPSLTPLSVTRDNILRNTSHNISEWEHALVDRLVDQAWARTKEHFWNEIDALIEASEGE